MNITINGVPMDRYYKGCFFLLNGEPARMDENGFVTHSTETLTPLILRSRPRRVSRKPWYFVKRACDRRANVLK
jgi:hypothetical protein